MKFAASQDNSLMKLGEDVTVQATVGIGPHAEQSFGLTVALTVTVPRADRAALQRLADAGHKICPYSHATQGNIDVTTTVTV